MCYEYCSGVSFARLTGYIVLFVTGSRGLSCAVDCPSACIRRFVYGDGWGDCGSCGGYGCLSASGWLAGCTCLPVAWKNIVEVFLHVEWWLTDFDGYRFGYRQYFPWWCLIYNRGVIQESFHVRSITMGLSVVVMDGPFILMLVHSAPKGLRRQTNVAHVAMPASIVWTNKMVDHVGFCVVFDFRCGVVPHE